MVAAKVYETGFGTGGAVLLVLENFLGELLLTQGRILCPSLSSVFLLISSFFSSPPS